MLKSIGRGGSEARIWADICELFDKELRELPARYSQDKRKGDVGKIRQA